MTKEIGKLFERAGFFLKQALSPFKVASNQSPGGLIRARGWTPSRSLLRSENVTAVVFYMHHLM